MIHVANALAWGIVSSVGITAYRLDELGSQGEIVLAICVGLFGWNMLAAIFQ